MGTILTINECLDEVQRLVNEGHNIREAIKIVKRYSQADQSIENSQNKSISDIIAPGENIDNGQVYSEVTGETLRDLI